jgi:hypothetical protein
MELSYSERYEISYELYEGCTIRYPDFVVDTYGWHFQTGDEIGDEPQ